MNTSVTAGPPAADAQARRILVAAGEAGTADQLTAALRPAGYRVETAGTVAESLARLADHPVDLVVVDTALPDLQESARRPRLAAADRPPLLFLTACESLDWLVPGLGLRATDYVTKPLRTAEVLARVQVLLRDWSPGRRARRPRYGDLVLDDATCQARRGARVLELSPAEYRLLRYLLVNAEQVFSKDQIGWHVWGELHADNAIEKLMSRLRGKVDREDPALIHTRRGFGYWLGR